MSFIVYKLFLNKSELIRKLVKIFDCICYMYVHKYICYAHIHKYNLLHFCKGTAYAMEFWYFLISKYFCVNYINIILRYFF